MLQAGIYNIEEMEGKKYEAQKRKLAAQNTQHFSSKTRIASAQPDDNPHFLGDTACVFDGCLQGAGESQETTLLKD